MPSSTAEIAKLTEYFWTVLHLKPAQLVYLVRRKLPRSLAKPTDRYQLPRYSSHWTSPIPSKVVLDSAGRVKILNQIVSLAAPSQGEKESNLPALLQYHRHYFDELLTPGPLPEGYSPSQRISDWVRANPPAEGVAWDPYPTSRRIVNWIKWSLSGGSLLPAHIDSLACQTAHLVRRLEYELLANHLFVNAKALVFAGVVLQGASSDSWRRRGIHILEEQLEEQILADGGHFERSPMYHAAILEDLLDLINLGQAYATLERERKSWAKAVERMLKWLTALCHPDRKIAFFNDAAFEMSPTLGELESYAERLGIGPPVSDSHWASRSAKPNCSTSPTPDFEASPSPSAAITHLSDSGYVRVDRDDIAALIDLAPIGPDYQPGHAHADTLSFELSLSGQRLFVNSGTSTYEEGEERLRQRGTLAHNTVTVNGENSSEVWKSFRVARRARPFDVSVVEEGERIRVFGAHDGFRRLRGKPVHRREWVFDPCQLRITDRIDGRFESTVASFHLHPDVHLTLHGDSEVQIEMPDGRVAHFQCLDGQLEIENSTWHPEFNLSIPNKVIRCSFLTERLTCELEWILSWP